ncbi:MAG: DNA (cytosine-5-)-methyltransferase [Verrucomicrobiota bacterium]
MKYFCTCSGISATSLAWQPLGWDCTGFAEVAPFPSAVLSERFPDTKNYGDFTKIPRSELPRSVDVLVGGTPCQSFSIAGLRKGLRDPRGNLSLAFLSLAQAIRPRWVVWENVAGVLSSEGGRDFATFIRGLEELGLQWAYRVLDAQYFGVPQRRRRVLVIAGPRARWNRPAQILFEPDSLSRDLTPSRPARENDTISPCLRSQANSSPRADSEAYVADHVAPAIAQTVTAGFHKGLTQDQTLIPFDTTQITHPENRSNPQPGDLCHTPAIAYTTSGGGSTRCTGFATGTLDTGTDQNSRIIQIERFVRRLTPRECERLQGMPDDYTLINFKGKPAKDSPRYKAIGNSMAVPKMRWLGERISGSTNQ